MMRPWRLMVKVQKRTRMAANVSSQRRKLQRKPMVIMMPARMCSRMRPNKRSKRPLLQTRQEGHTKNAN
eukprot:7077587-Karenia_brevis.AAC.1